MKTANVLILMSVLCGGLYGQTLFDDINNLAVNAYIFGSSNDVGQQYSHAVVTTEHFDWIKIDLYKHGNNNPVETILFENLIPTHGGFCLFYSKVTITGRNIPFNLIRGAFNIEQAYDHNTYRFSILGSQDFNYTDNWYYISSENDLWYTNDDNRNPVYINTQETIRICLNIW